MDILSDTARALRAAGVEGDLVRSVMREQRSRWGGGAVYVRAVDPGERQAAILEAVGRGLSVRRTAAVAGCSDDTVRRVLGRG